MDGISRSSGWDNRSCGWDKEILHAFLPMEKLILRDKWGRKSYPRAFTVRSHNILR